MVCFRASLSTALILHVTESKRLFVIRLHTWRRFYNGIPRLISIPFWKIQGIYIYILVYMQDCTSAIQPSLSAMTSSFFLYLSIVFLFLSDRREKLDIIWKQVMAQENIKQMYNLVCNALVNVCICQDRERYLCYQIIISDLLI